MHPEVVVRPVLPMLCSPVRDFAQVKARSIDTEIAQFALEALNIDKYGLDEIDNKILCTIIDKFKGGPVGITTIATALGEDAGTIEEVYEPFLIKEGFMKRTPRGREVTELAISIWEEVFITVRKHCLMTDIKRHVISGINGIKELYKA